MNTEDTNQNEEMQAVNDENMYQEPEYEGPRKSRWDKFRAFSYGNKRVVFLLLLLSILGSFGAMARSDDAPKSVEGLVQSYFERFTDKGVNWTYSTGSYFVSDGHLKSQFPVLANYTWGPQGAAAVKSNKKFYKAYVDEQLNTDLLVQSALKEGMLNSPEARLVLENGIRKLISEYYVASKIANEKSDYRTVVSDQEVLGFYKKNEVSYSQQNISKEKALPVIRRTLEEVKRNNLRIHLQTSRANIIKILKDTSGYKIRR